MKTSRVTLIVVVLLIVVVIAIAAYTALLPSNKSPWKSVATYPLRVASTYGVSGEQCVNSTVYIICIGGQDVALGPHDGVYTSSPISFTISNITSWSSDPNYPEPIFAQSCVVSSGYVYCVGGTYDDTGDDVSYSYYASVGNNGVVGVWNQTTGYPAPADDESCVASAGYIYCIGGSTEPSVGPTGLNASRGFSNEVYFAPISSSGIGTWRPSTTYPVGVYDPTCYASSGYVYCLGGTDGSGNALNTDYYASLTSTGVGPWTATQAYPFQGIGQACAFSGGRIFCVGGEVPSGFVNYVYYATVSSSGIGGWTKAANYPDSVWTTCTISAGNMYCVGGADSSSNGETGVTYYIALATLIS